THHDPQSMLVVVESAARRQRTVERLLARMAEGRVADVVRQAERFGQVLVETQSSREYAADLCHLEAVRQPHAKMIAIGRDEDLGLAGQAAEGDRMDDPVAVALEFAARSAAALVALREFAPARRGGIGSVGRAGHGAWATA